MHPLPVQDALSDPLVIILAHPNHTVCIMNFTLFLLFHSPPSTENYPGSDGETSERLDVD